jgi:hypothetical protein
MYQKHKRRGSHLKSSLLKQNAKHKTRILLLVTIIIVVMSLSLTLLYLGFHPQNPRTMNVQKLNYELLYFRTTS